MNVIFFSPWRVLDDAISAPSVPGREPGADSVATNKDGIEVGQVEVHKMLIHYTLNLYLEYQ